MLPCSIICDWAYGRDALLSCWEGTTISLAKSDENLVPVYKSTAGVVYQEISSKPNAGVESVTAFLP